MFFKDFVSVKRQKIKRGASQTYDTPSNFVFRKIQNCTGCQIFILGYHLSITFSIILGATLSAILGAILSAILSATLGAITSFLFTSPFTSPFTSDTSPYQNIVT